MLQIKSKPKKEGGKKVGSAFYLLVDVMERKK
jgi:hypothetical protein